MYVRYAREHMYRGRIEWLIYILHPPTVPLHPTQQPLPPRPHKTKYQRRRDSTLPAQNRRSLHRVF